MKIRAGYEIAYDCAQATPMLLMLRVHPSRQSDLENPERIALDPPCEQPSTGTASVTYARA